MPNIIHFNWRWSEQFILCERKFINTDRKFNENIILSYAKIFLMAIIPK